MPCAGAIPRPPGAPLAAAHSGGRSRRRAPGLPPCRPCSAGPHARSYAARRHALCLDTGAESVPATGRGVGAGGAVMVSRACSDGQPQHSGALLAWLGHPPRGRALRKSGRGCLDTTWYMGPGVVPSKVISCIVQGRGSPRSRRGCPGGVGAPPGRPALPASHSLPVAYSSSVLREAHASPSWERSCPPSALYGGTLARLGGAASRWRRPRWRGGGWP